MNKSVDGGVDILQICAIDICVDAERADAPGRAAATIASARIFAVNIEFAHASSCVPTLREVYGHLTITSAVRASDRRRCRFRDAVRGGAQSATDRRLV
jgi:hypothetical protein